MRHVLRVGVLLSAFALSDCAAAQVVAGAGFTFSGSVPVAGIGWQAHSDAGSKTILTNGSVAILDQGPGPGEDVHLSYAAFSATAPSYVAFSLRVPSGNPVNPDGEGLYFLHFKDSGSSFRGHTGLLSPSGGGNFRLAVNADSANLGAGAAWGTGLLFDTDYQVVVRWSPATGQAQLWVNPAAETDPSVGHTGLATGTPISQIALRQSDDYTGFIHVDDVVVGHTMAEVLGAAPDHRPYGAGCGPHSAGLSRTVGLEFPEIGRNWVVAVTNVPSPEAALLVVGTDNPPLVDLTSIGAPGCYLYVSTDVLTQFEFGSGGQVTFTIPVPLDPYFVGLELYTQAGVFESGVNALGAVLSIGAYAQIGS